MPDFGWIRAATFYVYIDTPTRFRNKSALWRYCGIGLERRHSGNGPQRVRLCKGGNRSLKNILMGAAKTAITQADGPFIDKYEEYTQQKGMNPTTARRTIARSLAATLWSMWKNDERYDPDKSRRPEKSSLETR